MCNILWNEKSVQKVHTVHKTLLLLEVSWEYTTSTTSDFLLHYVQSADFFIMYNILWNEKSVQKVHTVHKTLLLLEVSWEYMTSTTPDFLLHYVQSALERKLGTKFYTVPETLLSISSFVHKYPKCQHHCYHCQWLHFKLQFLWSWCLPQFLHKKFTNFTFHIIICTQISKYPNVNIIAIIASDFTSNFSFCGLGAYHSFCTKNSHCARNFTFHIIICTQISKMSASLLSLPVTSLQTSVSVVLVPTTVFAQKIHKLYFPYHHLYTNIQISKCQHHCYHCQWLHFKLQFLWSWCLPQFLHKKFTLCPKLYFPYHHLYTNIQNVNIIAIIASDFTSNFSFCGLGAYHSFCTKNSQTLLSISSFVHKYPNIQMSTSLLSLPVTSLQTSVSVVLVPTTVFAQKIHTVPETLLSISSFVHKYPKCQHHCYHCQWLHFKLRFLWSWCLPQFLHKKFTLCPKLYFLYHHLYTNIQISKCQHHCYHCQWLHFKLQFLWSWCLPQFLHKKFTLCPKLYFPYHHLYTNIQNVNIIAIIASDFTSNFSFCGLGAYHSFCTKNSQTLLSISSFVHKYPNIQMSTSLLSLPVTSLQTSVSVVLVPTTIFALSTLYIQEAAICTWLLCTKL